MGSTLFELSIFLLIPHQTTVGLVAPRRGDASMPLGWPLSLTTPLPALLFVNDSTVCYVKSMHVVAGTLNKFLPKLQVASSLVLDIP